MPIWFMRQAGRYLPEYRALREQAGDFLTLCLTPDYASEVTLQPLRRFDIDAAIIFADILLVPMAFGQTLAFVEGEGPVLTPALIDKPLWLGNDYQQERLTSVFDSLRRVRGSLAADKDLIGFAGAPWTVLSYMIRGSKQRTLTDAVNWARAHPEQTAYWLDTLTQATIQYLKAQVAAGATVLQLFDTWAGIVPSDQQLSWLFEPAKTIRLALQKAHPDVPFIYFGKGLNHALPEAQRYISADGLGIDFSLSPETAAQWFDSSVVLQGNLDPDVLRLGGDAMPQAINQILQAWQGRPAIFNLGHGILPQTPIAHVQQMLDHVRQQTMLLEKG